MTWLLTRSNIACLEGPTELAVYGSDQTIKHFCRMLEIAVEAKTEHILKEFLFFKYASFF